MSAMPPSQDALRDSLDALAQALQNLINDALTQGDRDTAARLQNSQDDLSSAARRINDADTSALVEDVADGKLKLLASEIGAKADAIARDEKNVARIVGIATGAVILAARLEAGDIPGAVKAGSDITKILD